jgi:hypothetical protein
MRDLISVAEDFLSAQKGLIVVHVSDLRGNGHPLVVVSPHLAEHGQGLLRTGTDSCHHCVTSRIII